MANELLRVFGRFNKLIIDWFAPDGHKSEHVAATLVDALGVPIAPAAFVGLTDAELRAAVVPITGNVNATLVANPLPVTDTWHPDYLDDAGPNDSDKTFTIVAAEEWMILAVQVTLITTANAGNRQMAVDFFSPTGVMVPVMPGVVQAESLTRYYTFGVGLPNDAVFRGPASDRLATGIPPLTLGAGWGIRVYDLAAIQPAADDMSVRVCMIRRTV